MTTAESKDYCFKQRSNQRHEDYKKVAEQLQSQINWAHKNGHDKLAMCLYKALEEANNMAACFGGWEV